jgi:hypothetical protein
MAIIVLAILCTSSFSFAEEEDFPIALKITENNYVLTLSMISNNYIFER